MTLAARDLPVTKDNPNSIIQLPGINIHLQITFSSSDNSLLDIPRVGLHFRMRIVAASSSKSTLFVLAFASAHNKVLPDPLIIRWEGSYLH